MEITEYILRRHFLFLDSLKLGYKYAGALGFNYSGLATLIAPSAILLSSGFQESLQQYSNIKLVEIIPSSNMASMDAQVK